MGWISERAMRRGHALYNGGPKRKGPLKRVVAVIAGNLGTNLFGYEIALLECGHISRSYGGKRAICTKCKDGQPIDMPNNFGVDVPKSLEQWNKGKKLD